MRTSRARTRILALVLAGALVASMLPFSPAEETAQTGRPAVELLPSGPAMFLEVPDLPAAARACKGSDLAALVRNERVWNFLMWLRANAMGQSRSYLGVAQAVKWFYEKTKGGFAAALYPPHRFSQADSRREIVAVFRVGPDFSLDELRSAFKSWGMDEPRSADVAGLPGKPLVSGGMTAFTLNGNLVLCRSAAGALAVVAAARKRDGAFLSPLRAQAAKGGTVARFFFDASAAGDLLGKTGDLLASKGIRGLTLTLDVEGGLFVGRTALLGGATAEPFSYLLPLEGDGWLDRVPHDAVGFLRLRCRPGATADSLLDIQDRLAGPRSLLKSEEFARFVRQLPGPLSEILDEVFDGRIGICFFFAPQGWVPGSFASLGLKPGKKEKVEEYLDTAFEAVNAAAEGSVPPCRTGEYRGRRMFQILLKDAARAFGSLTDAVPAACVDEKGDSLLVANGFAGLKSLIRHPRPERSIRTNDLFAALRYPAAPSASGGGWLNYSVAVRRLLPLMLTVGAFRGDHAVDPPVYEEIRPWLKGTALQLVREGDDLVLYDRGSLPLVSSIMGFFVASGVLMQLFPEGFPAGRNGAALTSEQRLKELYALMRRYAAAHGGRFPPSLDDVAEPGNLFLFSSPETGSKIDPNDVDGSSDYFYFRGLEMTDGSLPLLANRLVLEGGSRWVLMANGSVVRVRDTELKMLVERYIERTGRKVVLESGMLFWF